MKIIRLILGKLLTFISNLTSPQVGQRNEDEQRKIEEELKTYSLYQFNSCPYCIKVRRAMRRLNLPIELRNANTDESIRAELIAKGGRSTVPCLRIGDTWMYESSDIIKHLEDKFPIS